MLKRTTTAAVIVALLVPATAVTVFIMRHPTEFIERASRLSGRAILGIHRNLHVVAIITIAVVAILWMGILLRLAWDSRNG